MNQLAVTLRAIAAQLLSEAAQLEKPAEPVPATPAPFGTYADGQPKPAPAYDACRQMWEAAQRDGVFDMHKFTGPGVQEGAAQMYAGRVTDWRAVENVLLDLGKSAWGQAWLAHDVNAEVVLVAVVEVLDPRVALVAGVLRPSVLSTSSRRRPRPIIGATALDPSRRLPAVSFPRIAVPSWGSGTTRLNIARASAP